MDMIDIKIPAPPEGHEAVLNDGFTSCDYVLTCSDGWVKTGCPEVRAGIVARKKSTLADWANKQRLFQALAEIAKDYQRDGICIATQDTLKHGQWVMGKPIHFPNMGEAPVHGKLRLEAGKWVDA